MNIAMIGTRGVPACYGGFETCVEELGKRLVARGHSVTVYCRKEYYDSCPDQYLGMNLIYLPCLRKKSVETLSHTFLSIWHAIRQNFDALMIFNAANSPILLLPRLLGKKIAINTDGLEWKRGKWGRVGRSYYKFSEWFATKIANRIISDSQGIQDYYLKRYKAKSVFIAYGAYPHQSNDPSLLQGIGVRPGEYFLQVTRFEPENNPLLTIHAFKQLETDKKLVLIGGAPYESDYLSEIKKEINDNIIIPGPIYESNLLNEIWCNCFAYVHGNEVGGTNPALLQAMGNRCFVIAIDVCFSRDVLDHCGIYFEKNIQSLSSKMNWSLENFSKMDKFKDLAVRRIKDMYSWDIIAEKYEKMFRSL